MKKRLLSTILVLAMVISLGLTAYANPEEVVAQPIAMTARYHCEDDTVYPGGRVTLFADYYMAGPVAAGDTWKFQWYKSVTDTNVDGTIIPLSEANSQGNAYIPNTVEIGTTYYYAEMTYTPNGMDPQLYRSNAVPVTVVPRVGDHPLLNMLTTAEASGWMVSTPSQDVIDYYKIVEANSGGRVWLSSAGKTVQGTDIPLVIIGQPAPKSAADVPEDKAIVLINANIHSGEIEGKEAMMILTREIAMGLHDDLLKDMVILIVANMNPDGNDYMLKARLNTQYTPKLVGARTNVAGTNLYNINRDMMKLDTAEARALVSTMNDWDPTAFVDLHATNGTLHRIPLETLWCLHPDVDPDLSVYNRTGFVDATLGKNSTYFTEAGKVVVPYGDFERVGSARDTGYKDGGVFVVGADEKPRYTSHYGGMRNRLSLLFEAYSHDPYTVRVDTQYIAVKSFLRGIQNEKDTMMSLIAQADARALGRVNGLDPAKDIVTITASRTSLYNVTIPSYAANPDANDLISYYVVRDELVSEANPLGERSGTLYAGEKDYVDVAYQGHYVTATSVPMGAYYLIEEDCTAAVELLKRHGLEVTQLKAPVTINAGDAQWFNAATRTASTYEGRPMNAVSGDWKATEAALTFPVGTYVVSTAQIHGNIAALLMEPAAPDSLVAYSFLLDPMTNYEGKLRANYLSNPTGVTGTIAIPVFKVADFKTIPPEIAVLQKDVKVGNGQANVDFAIKSANGKGYSVYISTNGGKSYTLYTNVNYNSKGAHIKGLTNGKTYLVKIAYDENGVQLMSNAVTVVPNK